MHVSDLIVIFDMSYLTSKRAFAQDPELIDLLYSPTYATREGAFADDFEFLDLLCGSTSALCKGHFTFENRSLFFTLR